MRDSCWALGVCYSENFQIADALAIGGMLVRTKLGGTNSRTSKPSSLKPFNCSPSASSSQKKFSGTRRPSVNYGRLYGELRSVPQGDLSPWLTQSCQPCEQARSTTCQFESTFKREKQPKLHQDQPPTARGLARTPASSTMSAARDIRAAARESDKQALFLETCPACDKRGDSISRTLKPTGLKPFP